LIAMTFSFIRIGVVIIILLLNLLVSCKKSLPEEIDMLPAIRVRILNGCGHHNAASEYSRYLTQYNVDVIGIGNADKFIYDKSIIVVKRDDQQDLERLKSYTGIERSVYAISERTTESFHIILGNDYRTYME